MDDYFSFCCNSGCSGKRIWEPKSNSILENIKNLSFVSCVLWQQISGTLEEMQQTLHQKKTRPPGHICNDIETWGKGFVLALSARWKEPEKQYREWFKSEKYLALGQVQFVRVADNTWVANLIGQRDIRKD